METKQTQMETNLENLQNLLDQINKGIINPSEIKTNLSNTINFLCEVNLLTTRAGFIESYFSELINKQQETNELAFEHVNKMHEEYFGEYKFKDYSEFREFMNVSSTNSNILLRIEGLCV